MNLLILIIITLINTSWGRLETNPGSETFKADVNKKYSSDLVNRCIASVTKSRPELAAQAADICSRLANKSKSIQKTAGRTMEDCLRFARQFSMSQETTDFLCSNVVASFHPTKPEKRADYQRLKTNSSDQNEGAL